MVAEAITEDAGGKNQTSADTHWPTDRLVVANLMKAVRKTSLVTVIIIFFSFWILQLLMPILPPIFAPYLLHAGGTIVPY